MRAEDAAVHVRLVDDHVAEVVQHVAPAVVVRQHAEVEHVRVREDDVRPLADLPAALALGVAVVDRGFDALETEGGERTRLVLRERLRRIEVERPRLRLLREGVEHREVEGEALAAGRAGRDDGVLAAADGFPRLRLVAPEARDSLRDERGCDPRIEVVRERLAATRASRLGHEVGELPCVEQVSPGGGRRRHRTIEAAARDPRDPSGRASPARRAAGGQAQRSATCSSVCGSKRSTSA